MNRVGWCLVAVFSAGMICLGCGDGSQASHARSKGSTAQESPESKTRLTYRLGERFSLRLPCTGGKEFTWALVKKANPKVVRYDGHHRNVDPTRKKNEQVFSFVANGLGNTSIGFNYLGSRGLKDANACSYTVEVSVLAR
ncbi:MAG: hypothetical protein ACYTGH_10325 [Planctomycetota bacterium]|jgi:hypothetical protein